MRKHIISILAIFAFVFLLFSAYKTNNDYFKSRVIICDDKSDKQCLLEKRKKRFSNQWQMKSWDKSTNF